MWAAPIFLIFSLSRELASPPSLAKCTEYSHLEAAACADSTVHVWDVVFSTNGSLLTTAGDDGRVKIWKMNGNVPSPEGHVVQSAGQGYVAFSPDGKLLAVGSNSGQLQLLDATTFERITNLAGHGDDIEALAFTSDSRHLWAIDYSGVLTRHDIGTGSAAVASIPTGSTGYTLALSPVMTASEQWLAIGFDDGKGNVANVVPGQTTPTVITVSADMLGVFGMSFSPDGKTLVAGGIDGMLGFWNIPPPANGASSGTPITVPDTAGAAESIKAVKFSPDGKYLAISTGDPKDEWKLGIWDAATRRNRVSKVPAFTPLSVAWSPSGGIIVAGEDSCGQFIVCAD